MTAIPERILKVRVGPAGGEGREWTAPLYIEADIERTIGRHPNKATIKLYNLSDESVRWCEQSGQVCQVLAGEELASQAFYGDITARNVITTWAGPTRVTTIRAADGRRVFRDQQFSASYPPATSRDQVLNDLIQAATVPLGFRAELDLVLYANGWAWAGRWRDAMTEILKPDAAWDIQDGALRIMRVGELEPGNALVINASTGMIGSPQRTNKGINLETKLVPALRPGVPIRVESREITGEYLVTKLNHKANSKGLVWKTVIAARG